MEACEIIVNNHTCEIIDFIGGGNVNKRSIFYNNMDSTKKNCTF